MVNEVKGDNRFCPISLMEFLIAPFSFYTFFRIKRQSTHCQAFAKFQNLVSFWQILDLPGKDQASVNKRKEAIEMLYFAYA